MKTRKIVVGAVVVLVIALGWFFLRGGRARVPGGGAPITGGKVNLSYFGIGQMRKAAEQADYLPYIQEQKKYSNIIGLSFEFDKFLNLTAPKESYLSAIGSYPKTVLMLGRDPWFRSYSDRQKLFSALKHMNGYENIDVIVVIDEPYLGDWTPAQLKDIILEAKQTFPGKELAVNYNPRGFYDQKQGRDAPLFDEYLDYISFDMYPANFGAACDDETVWKQKIQQAIRFFKGKTNDPLIYIGQGFSKKGCMLTPEMVQWTFDAANGENIFGLVLWFSEDIVADLGDLGAFTGFSNKNTAAAENRIIELGKSVLTR